MVDEKGKSPRVERAKQFKREVAARVTEVQEAKVKANSHEAYTTLVEQHKVSKTFAKKVKKVLEKIRGSIFQMY